MPNGDQSVDEALGTLCLSADTIPHHDTAKLDYGDAPSAQASARAAGPGAAPADAAPGGTSAGGTSAGGRHDDAREAVDRLGQALSDAGNALCELLFPHGRGGATTPTPGGPVRPNTEEGFYLLATFCFDLERKMEYLYRATRAFALQGNPAIARELLADQESFNVEGLTWKERAKRSEARLRELQRKFGPEHERLLRQVAGGGDTAPGGPTGGPTEGPTGGTAEDLAPGA
jgi:hypothetical protein